MNEKKNADYYANLLPDGKKSTKGLGKTAPSTGKKMDDGVFVPLGVGQSTGINDVNCSFKFRLHCFIISS